MSQLNQQSAGRSSRLLRIAASAAIILTTSAAGLSAAKASECAPPHGFVETAAPDVAPTEQLVAHTEEITIDRPLAVVVEADSKTSLKAAIHKAGSLPGVSGDYRLNAITPGTPGAKHIVCLTDGSTLVEQILVRDLTKTSYRFRYVVWNYTTAQARPIEYGVGEFRYSQIGQGRTHIVWTYAFKLKDHEFPGSLGALGGFLFQVGFLDRQYAAMMRGTLENSRAAAEKLPAAGG